MLKKVVIAAIVLIGTASMAFREQPPSGKNELDTDSRNLETFSPVVVLELFTSQGCSSCPAADALLEKVKNQNPDRVFTLSYHVDYWNYIGWKDPFSNAQYAQKQGMYNLKLGSRSNYTPEVVVNGKAHFVGSDRSKMTEMIDRYGAERTLNEIELTRAAVNKESIEFAYRTKGAVKGKMLRAVLVLDQRFTKVQRGENRNRVLKNSNIVVGEKTVLLQYKEGKGTLAIPELVTDGEKIHLILLVEDGNRDITAAAKRSFTR